MQSKLIFVLYSLLLLISNKAYTQHSSWNLLLEKNVARFIGSQVYETDSFYIVVGTSIDTFGTDEQGFSASKVDKLSGKVVASRHYEEIDVEFDFNYCRKGFMIDDGIYFPQTTNTKPFLLSLFKISTHDLSVEKLLNIPPPDTTSKYDMFLNDFGRINDDAFIAATYYTGEYNTPTFKSVEMLIKYNVNTKKDTILEYLDLDEIYTTQKIVNFNGNNLIFGTIVGDLLATGKMAIFYLDPDGHQIWEYQTPSLSPIHDVKDIYPINDKEVLLASYDSYFSYADLNLYSRWTVTRYDVINKKIIWSNFWNEPHLPYIWSTAKIIKTKKDGEYFLMANDYEGHDTVSFAKGKVIKFNDKGQRLWQKNYFYNSQRGLSNDFYNIIRTSDGNYLIVGSENLIQSAWLVKIDEDGNILPIDTTSASQDKEISHGIPEVSIYPNPASHTIIINQGEITDMTYHLIDMSGVVIKTLPLPQAHHNVIWDITDVPTGTYAMTMTQRGIIIGSKLQVIVR
ncbi:MAG: T9SS type A sorting domain-containing protein [Saprospiraceae bacterium]